MFPFCLQNDIVKCFIEVEGLGLRFIDQATFDHSLLSRLETVIIMNSKLGPSGTRVQGWNLI